MSLIDGTKNHGNRQAITVLLCCVSVGAVAIAFAASYYFPPAAPASPEERHQLVPAADQIASGRGYASEAGARKMTAAKFRAARLAAPVQEEITLTAVGDIMLSRTVGARMVKKGYDYPFRMMSPFLKSADITFGNLETPIIAGAPVVSGEMSFRADPGVAKELANAGFDVLSLANNHTPNRGQRGLEQTENLLKSAGLAYAGEGKQGEIRPAVIEAKGVKFAFLAYTEPALVPASYGPAADRRGTSFMDLDSLKGDIAAIRESADVVVVSMHAGAEYTELPGDSQMKFAHAAIDAGADLVIGHHPHVVQTIERYRDGLILYSLGNFIFDQDWSRETRDGLAVRLVYEGPRLSRAEFFPVSIDESQPRLASGDDADRVMGRLGIVPVELKALAWDAVSQSPQPVSLRTVAMESADPGQTARLELARDESGTGDGFRLEDGRLRLLAGGSAVWQTPDEAWVDSWAMADIDGNGFDELAVSAWMPGQFGESRPFWLSDDPTKMTSRLLIYGLKDGLPVPRWFSSGLARPNCRVTFSDLDRDGSAELIASEGDYADAPNCLERRVSVWRWGGWGFVNQWMGPDTEAGSGGRVTFEPFEVPAK